VSTMVKLAFTLVPILLAAKLSCTAIERGQHSCPRRHRLACRSRRVQRDWWQPSNLRALPSCLARTHVPQHDSTPAIHSSRPTHAHILFRSQASPRPLPADGRLPRRSAAPAPTPALSSLRRCIRPPSLSARPPSRRSSRNSRMSTCTSPSSPRPHRAPTRRSSISPPATRPRRRSSPHRTQSAPGERKWDSTRFRTSGQSER
jgi:hypothetical protein